MSLIKRTPADTAFSDCVRERAAWVCERCGKGFIPPTAGLHCAHIYGRAHKSVRLHADNALALCFPCHRWQGGNPLEFSEWLRGYMGEAKLDMLRERRNMPLKLPKAAIAEAARHYRAELAKMHRARLQGHVGRLEFESWV